MKELLCKHCGARREWHHFYDLACLLNGKKLKTFYLPVTDNSRPGRKSVDVPASREYFPERSVHNGARTIKRAGGAEKLRALSPEARRLLLGISEKEIIQ